VWHVRDLLDPGLSIRFLARQSRVTLAVSEAAARQLPPPVRTLPNAVRLADFRTVGPEARRALRSQWRVPLDAPLVGQVARFAPWKGQHRFLDAAAAVLRAHPEAHFVLVGDDIFGTHAAYARELRERVAGGELAGRVVFAGWREDVPAVLAALDVLVHASRDEPFGRILIEAAAAGVPVVADSSGATREIVTHERTGLLMAPGEPTALARGVARLLSDSTLAQTLGDGAQELAAQRYDASAGARAMEEVFAEVLAVA
jgi:glycosyltransferase involved in cell wall biosynthesis